MEKSKQHSSGEKIHVSGYTTKNGKHVKDYYRSRRGFGEIIGQNYNFLNDNDFFEILAEKNEDIPPLSWKAKEALYEFKKELNNLAFSSLLPYRLLTGNIGKTAMRMYNAEQNKALTDATFLMDLSIKNPRTVPDNSEFSVLDKSFNYKLSKLFDNRIQPGVPVVLFSPNSQLANTVLDSKDFNREYKANSGQNYFDFTLNETQNLFRAINKARVYNRGSHSILGDGYDFEFKPFPKDYLPGPKINSFANISGMLMSDDILNEYYTLLPLIINK